MQPPNWAVLERRLLAENVPACHEFFKRYFDERGYLQCFVRWGANDGPDDAFENFNHWPELHALGATLAIGILDYAFPLYLQNVSTLRVGTTFLFIVIALVWFYVLALIVLAGAAVQTGTGGARPLLGQPPGVP